MCLFLGILVLAAGLLFARPVLQLMNTKEELMEGAVLYLTVYLLGAGLGKSTVPTVIVIMGSVVFRIIWIYTIFAYFHTLESLYLLYVCAWAVTAICGNLYFLVNYRSCRKP